MKNVFCRLLYIFPIFILLSCGGGSSAEIEAKNAKKYVGWAKNVKGYVASVKPAEANYKNPNYINFTKDYPHQDLTIVVYGDFKKKFKLDLASLKGKTLLVKGKIEWYRGNLQIRYPQAIKVIE